MSYGDLRREYERAALDEASVVADPFEQFRRWFDEAVRLELALPNTMVLATADPQGKASVRAVLMKGFDAQGFVFYTDYESRKAQELETNPWASALFFWEPLERQVRIEGPVTRTSSTESDAYYASRPLGSRLGAWASPQSRVIPDRAALERRLQEAHLRHGDSPPRPEGWGGYRIQPASFEFWQGRPDRLHDRLVYRARAGGWTIERLGP